jgi:ATP:corrinoid adenosyltransferase
MAELAMQILEPEKQVGLMVVITGHGKGKTTSALGIVLRAIGYDMKVCLMQQTLIKKPKASYSQGPGQNEYSCPISCEHLLS